MTEPGEVRASDEDRDEAAAALGDHWAAGRLDDAELDRRVGAAYAAVTRGDLATLLRDLPGERGGATAPERRLLVPGILHFQERVEVAASREGAFDAAVSSLAPALGAAGYHLVDSDRPERLRFVRRTGRLMRAERPLTVLFLPSSAGGSRIVAFGEAPLRVRKAFAELRG